MRCVACILVLLVSTSIASVEVRAQSSGASGRDTSDEHLRAFKEKMARGVKAFEQEEYERALEHFRDARSIADPPTVEYNIGRTLLSLQRCREAKATFESYLEREELSAAERQKGNERLAQARDDCRGTGRLEVVCQPESAGAEIWIAGGDRTCPASLELAPGSHRMKISAPGFHPYEGEIKVRSGETLRQVVTLEERIETNADSDRNRASRAGRRATQIGGLVVGSTLLAVAIGSDLSIQSRIDAFRRARQEGDREELDALQREAQRARTRTAILYVTGSIVTLGAGSWLAVDLLSGPSSESRANLRLHLGPSRITGSLRW